MSRADDRAQVNEVTVLIGLVRMIVDSDTLHSKALSTLVTDIAAIPDRFAAVKAADYSIARSWKKRSTLSGRSDVARRPRTRSAEPSIARDAVPRRRRSP